LVTASDLISTSTERHLEPVQPLTIGECPIALVLGIESGYSPQIYQLQDNYPPPVAKVRSRFLSGQLSNTQECPVLRTVVACDRNPIPDCSHQEKRLQLVRYSNCGILSSFYLLPRLRRNTARIRPIPPSPP
jgi:hypothetical protein